MQPPMDFKAEHERNCEARAAGEITDDQYLARAEEIMIAEMTFTIDSEVVNELLEFINTKEAGSIQEWKCGYPLNPRGRR